MIDSSALLADLKAQLRTLQVDLKERADDPSSIENIVFHEPFGFFDYVHLQMKAKCTLSDSGTISEESAILGFPAVTLRDAIERPESLDAGSIIMTGLDSENVVEAVQMVITTFADSRPPCAADYQVAATSLRTVAFIASTHRRHAAWAGLRTR